MIHDKDTNTVYMSRWLMDWRDLFKELTSTLKELEIPYGLLPYTNDIWVRDFMPIQLSQNDFLKYRYAPDYLVKVKGRRQYITNCSTACRRIGITPRESEIIIDGGNVVACADKIVMTDKVFTENGVAISDADFLERLERTLGHKVIIIPWHPTGELEDDSADVFGHSDGLVRYCSDNRILMGNHRESDPHEASRIRQTLEDNGFDVTEMLFETDCPNRDFNWAYINFLQVGSKIIMPKFGIAEDDQARKYIQAAFPDCIIRQVDCSSIASEGGALHCITWTVRR